jgi:UDP-2,4-diacetamido-2,4,6-trideoxy-beta-L-altropyranose hydrolase
MKGQQIAFRVDASLQIGAGHVMRCLTLANALRDQGATCRFVCRSQEGDLIDLLHKHEYEVLALATPTNNATRQDDTSSYTDWLMTPWQADAKQTQAALLAVGTQDWLVVDHYALDARWEEAISESYEHLLVIDDLANRQHQADLLLDQTFERNSTAYRTLVNPTCELCCGIEYVLLRPEFDAWRERSLEHRDRAKLKRVLISLGGVDKINLSREIIKALLDDRLPSDLEICLVLGASSPWARDMQYLCETMPSVELKVAVDNMAELLSNCDIAIGAAGSSAWERCCLGVPTLMLVMAENQREIARRLSAVGAAHELTPGSSLREEVVRAMHGIYENPTKLVNMSRQAAAMVPGSGVRKIVQAMMGMQLCQ